MMRVYALVDRDGLYLAVNSTGMLAIEPEFITNKNRAITLAEAHSMRLVEFNVPVYRDRQGRVKPSHGKGY